MIVRVFVLSFFDARIERSDGKLIRVDRTLEEEMKLLLGREGLSVATDHLVEIRNDSEHALVLFLLELLLSLFALIFVGLRSLLRWLILLGRRCRLRGGRSL